MFFSLFTGFSTAVAAISLGAYEFRPRRWASVAALAGIALTLALGQWQTGRARYKDNLQQRYEAQAREPALRIGGQLLERDALLFRRVEVRGEFAPQHTVFVDNRMYQHRPGYHVATPLRIAGSQRYVLVNRGWLPGNRDRSPPQVNTPAGEQVVQGIAVAYSERYLELSTQVAEGHIRQNLVLERYRQETGLDLQPFVIQQDGKADDGLVRVWSRPDLGRNTHLAYAFQWYALSFAIFIYYLVTHVQRRPAAKP
ncbi:MAG: SURF1 family protein [Burkholderiales bacterium]|nr:SURF1 family protein [Burkholderiales bacterium]